MTTWRRFELVKGERDTLARRLDLALAGLADLAVEVEVLRDAASAVVDSWTDPLDDGVHGEAVAALEHVLTDSRRTETS